MNILIADSGSTNTAWVLLEKGQKSFFSTEGLNPYFQSHDQLSEVINDLYKSELLSKKIDSILFFGAGSSNPETKKKLESAIKSTYPNSDLKIQSDLLGAGIACYGKGSGIISILGTGSNTGFYSDGKITKQLPSLGYVLGDEGSGSYFGKIILRDYFYGKMPQDLKDYIQKNNDLELEKILSNVYSKPCANRYIASFAKLLTLKKYHPYIQNLINKGLNEFIDKQINYFEETENSTVSFAGSLAFNLQDELKEVLAKKNIKMGKVLKEPIIELAKYYAF